MEPVRRVFLPADITKWEKSEAYQDIMGFLTSMNQSVKGKSLKGKCLSSDFLTKLSQLLDKISLWVDEIPPIDQPQRYGNKAFRDFYNKLKENCENEIRIILPESVSGDLCVELSTYLRESFGNAIRIDYGTGHELAFIMFLCCLYKSGALTSADAVATVNVVFKKYLYLSRKLQMTYKMEPAGSQGVYSLDDYQFVPFIWGSAQLMMNERSISPEMMAEQKILDACSQDYLFLSCITHILAVKTGPFAEHSNQLWNISAVQSWSKVNQGLFKMYKAEILNKFPIIQHVLFGSLLTLSPATSSPFPPRMSLGHLKGASASVAPKISLMASKLPPPSAEDDQSSKAQDEKMPTINDAS